MTRTARTSLVTLLVGAVVAVSALLGLTATSAGATTVPFADSNAVGYLGFCNAQNKQISSGPIRSHPFVAKAVSSAPAPANHGPPYGRATLYVFQPIQYVDPSNWSGKQLTAATAFSNPKAPMAVATIGDPAMIDFSSVFPLHFSGFAELRFYYTAAGQPNYNSTYPAAFIQVKGDTWTQVNVKPVNCTAGQAVSNERILGSRTNAPTAPVTPTTGKPGASGASGGGSGSAGGPSASGSGTSASTSPAADSSSTSSSSTGLIVAIVVAVVVLGGSAGFVYLRRRGTPGA